jgi:hypothetical protein
MYTETSGKYKDITSFIATHNEIEIKPGKVRIPANIRKDFYKLFDGFRLSFVEYLLADLLHDAKKQNDRYKTLEKEVMQSLELDEISIDPCLRRFLDDPCNELSRALFELTFDLLKNKVTVDYFNGQASNIIKSVFTSLYMSSYQKWLALSTVKLVKPDKLFTIELPEIEQYSIHKTGGREEPVIPPKKAKNLQFHYQNSAIFMVPDCIVHSQKLNKYISICTYFQKPTVNTINPSDKRVWLNADFDQIQTRYQILLYIGDTLEELSLIADRTRICQPDLIIKHIPRIEWLDESELLAINNNIIETFQPQLGIVTVLPEETSGDQIVQLKEKGIQAIKVGVSPEGLEPVIDMFAKYITGNQKQ